MIGFAACRSTLWLDLLSICICVLSAPKLPQLEGSQEREQGRTVIRAERLEPLPAGSALDVEELRTVGHQCRIDVKIRQRRHPFREAADEAALRGHTQQRDVTPLPEGSESICTAAPYTAFGTCTALDTTWCWYARVPAAQAGRRTKLEVSGPAGRSRGTGLQDRRRMRPGYVRPVCARPPT
jgi:hypothetical protein